MQMNTTFSLQSFNVMDEVMRPGSPSVVQFIPPLLDEVEVRTHVFHIKLGKQFIDGLGIMHQSIVTRKKSQFQPC